MFKEGFHRLTRRQVMHGLACGAVLLFCGYLRFINLNWGSGAKPAGGHPDEQIVISVVSTLPTNHFDTDMRRTSMPLYLQLAPYNFSSYEYCAYLWYWAVTGLERVERVVRPKLLLRQPVVIYRELSAWFGLLVCVLAYLCARCFLPRKFALLAALFTGILPLLVQDSHYARAESFVTAGTMAVVWMTLTVTARPSLRLCFWATFLLGFLMASKISLAGLLYLPLYGAWISLEPAAWRDQRRVWQHGWVLLLGGLAGFLLGVPYILVDWKLWWISWKVTRDQYARPFPPHGPDPEGYCFAWIANYFWQTFGAALLILAVIGIIYLVRRRQYRLLVILASPLLLYYFIFSMQESFFERNVSHVVPLVAILAAAGCAAIWEFLASRFERLDLRTAAMGVILLLAVWIPLGLSWLLAVKVLGAKLYEAVPVYDALLRDVYRGVPVYNDDLFFMQSLGRIHERLLANPNGYILRLGDANDATSRHRLIIAQQMYRMKPLVSSPGFFAEYPTSTLQVYHSLSYSWYLVR